MAAHPDDRDPMRQPIRGTLYPVTLRRLVRLARRGRGKTRRSRRAGAGTVTAGLILGAWLGLSPAHADPGAPPAPPVCVAVSSAGEEGPA